MISFCIYICIQMFLCGICVCMYIKMVYTYVYSYVQVGCKYVNTYGYVQVGYMQVYTCVDVRIYIHKGTFWRRPVECIKMQVIFRKRAIMYRALLRKMTYKDKASYGSSPPCMRRTYVFRFIQICVGRICTFCRRCLLTHPAHQRSAQATAKDVYTRPGIWSGQSLAQQILGGEDAQDALSLQVIFRKRAL